MASAMSFSTTESGFLCGSTGCSRISASPSAPYTVTAAVDPADGSFHHPYVFVTEVNATYPFPAGAFLACKRKASTTAASCDPLTNLYSLATRDAAGIVYSLVKTGDKFQGDGRFYSTDLSAPACAQSEVGCIVNAHDTVPTAGFFVFGAAAGSSRATNRIEIFCPFATPVTAPVSFSCNFCGLGTRAKGATTLSDGQTCQQKQDLFNSASTPGSYGSSSCSDAQQAYGSTCCEATCEMCPAGKSMRNSSEIAGHYSDGTLYTCGAARERLHSFAAASAECDLAVHQGQYRYLAAAACCFAPPPPPFPPGSKPPSPPPAVAPPTCDLCGGVPDVTHPTGRKVVTGILQPMCFAGQFETHGTSQLNHSDGTPAFEQDGFEWGTILGVDGAGAPHGAITGSGGQQVPASPAR